MLRLFNDLSQPNLLCRVELYLCMVCVTQLLLTQDLTLDAKKINVY